MATVTIIGSGMMGSALAFPALENGHEARLVGTHLDREIIDECRKTNRHPKFAKHFPKGIPPFPSGIRYYQVEEMMEAVKGADLIIGGVSSFGVGGFVGIFSYASTLLSGIGFGFVAERWGWNAAYLTMVVSAVLGGLALIAMWKADVPDVMHA